jgi:nucleoside-diphosphate-sugar epimerase
MARALIVGCGCHGTALGARLAEGGWTVRGTSRTDAGAERIAATGIEGVVADPDRVGTVLEHVGDVAVVVWALGEATGPTMLDVNGPRLESMLERLVDTPVRGFVLEGPREQPEGTEEMPAATDLVASASDTWHLPVRIVGARRDHPGEWLEAMRAATAELVGV